MDEQTIDRMLARIINMDEKLDSFATREEMMHQFDLVLNNFDRFAKLHETLVQELAVLRYNYRQLEERLAILEKKLQPA
jgi:hypothetical protein